MNTLPSPAPPLSEKDVERAYRDIFANEPPVYWNVDAAVAFIKDVSALLPAEQGVGLLNIFINFLNGNPSAHQIRGFIDSLLKKIKIDGMDAALSRHCDRIVDGGFSNFTKTVNDASHGSRRVVFVAHVPYFQILREAMYLRRNGCRAFLVTLKPIPENLIAVFKEHFDAIADSHQNVKLLGKLIGALEPDVFHVQCWMWNYWLGRLAIERKGGAAVVCEFYDITSVYAPRDALCRVWEAETVDLDLAMEGFICRQADAVISRFPEPVHEELRERHGGPQRALQFWPYPCPEFSHYAERKASCDDGVIRLVYTGCVIPLNEDHPQEMFPARGLLSACRKLLEQGLHIDFLIDPYRPLEPSDSIYKDYFQVAEEYPNFQIKDGVSPQHLAKEISSYDFALILFDYNLDELWTRPSLVKHSVGTKVFTTLEAGLPLLINSEYEYVSKFIEDNGLGVAVSINELDTVAEKIQAVDYDRMAANIRRFNEKHGMDKEIHRLIGLYDKITTQENA